MLLLYLVMDDRLYKFSRLAEIGNYTRTAKELHISQPALSIAIQKLERELGTEVFIRSGKRLVLTDAGQAAYQAALDHQDIASHLKETIGRIARKRPTIIIGMVDSVADKLCATEAFEQLEQLANVTVVVNNSRYLREGIERRRIDTALLIHDELVYPGLTSSVVGSEELRLVFHPDLANEVAASIQKNRLRDFISYDKPSTTFRHIQHYLNDIGIDVQTRLYSTSPSVMLGMVLRGKGCAVLPSKIVDSYITDGELLTLLKPISRPIALVSVVSKKLPSYLTRFLEESRPLLDPNC